MVRSRYTLQPRRHHLAVVVGANETREIPSTQMRMMGQFTSHDSPYGLRAASPTVPAAFRAAFAADWEASFALSSA